jgi:predicted AAA+ superfamily ATPase
LKRLFTYLVSNAAQLVSPSKLRRAAGVKSPTTVLEYFAYFESAYLIHQTPCFSWSAKAMSLAPKKLYITDPGIIRTSSVSFSENDGAFLENFVFMCLRLFTGDIFYFADRKGECDFIVNPHGKRPVCMQVCYELTTDNMEREIQGLFAALDFFDINEGVIVTRNSRDIIPEKGKTLNVVPAWDYDFAKALGLRKGAGSSPAQLGL